VYAGTHECLGVVPLLPLLQVNLLTVLFSLLVLNFLALLRQQITALLLIAAVHITHNTEAHFFLPCRESKAFPFLLADKIVLSVLEEQVVPLKASHQVGALLEVFLLQSFEFRFLGCLKLVLTVNLCLCMLLSKTLLLMLLVVNKALILLLVMKCLILLHSLKLLLLALGKVQLFLVMPSCKTHQLLPVLVLKGCSLRGHVLLHLIRRLVGLIDRLIEGWRVSVQFRNVALLHCFGTRQMLNVRTMHGACTSIGNNLLC
jgi:hypothetical protein